ncbi:MAG: replicative DNA helicase [Pirellulaceae bacterium]|nr:replicative DNA helicase [Pirellulaceae bacterium]
MSTTHSLDPAQRPDNNRTKKTYPKKISTEILDRQPPCNLEAEKGVLGSMMLVPEVCDEVVLLLRADDFYDEAHRTLYRHMEAMHDAGRRIDLMLLVEDLQASGKLEDIGGMSYLEEVFTSVANAAHAKYYSEIVRDKSTLRSLILAGTEILRGAYEENDAASELLNKSEQTIYSIKDNRDSGNVQSMDKMMQGAMDRLDARLRGDHSLDGIDTGFADLDSLLTGFHPSQLIVLAARPGMGKTALALNISEYVALQSKQPVLYVSLEMSEVELADRLLCSTAEVSSHKLRKWRPISDQERQRLVEKASDLSTAPLYVDDTPGRRVTDIAAVARRIRRQEGKLSLIVIDYLQLVEPDNPRDPRQEQVAKITRRLKLLSKDIKVPILCLAQLNRQAEEGRVTRPRLSHLRESGAIEQDADVVMFVHRAEVDQDTQEDRDNLAGEAELIVAKQRSGPTGDVPLTWRKEFTRFSDRAPVYQEDFSDYNQGEPF